MLQQGFLNERLPLAACSALCAKDFVTPAKAGVPLLRQGFLESGIPAYAGMTMGKKCLDVLIICIW
jgi:branched-subunit amino acid transport protein